MTCEDALILISGALDGTNTDPETVQLREHLENCEACRALQEALQRIDLDVHTLCEPVPEGLCDAVMQSIRKENEKKRPLRRWRNLAIAAGLVLVIGIGAMALPRTDSQTEASEMMMARNMAMPAEYAVQEAPVYDSETSLFTYDQTGTLDPQALAEVRGADVVVTDEMLSEMELCSCEVLENGAQLYRLETVDAAVQLSRLYGLPLYQPSERTENAISYALLIP